MAKYTYKDVIIDPEDPRVEIGKEYYGAIVSNDVIGFARDGDRLGILLDIDYRPFSQYPFLFETKTVNCWVSCLIRKKEPEKKYVPFDLNREEVRESLMMKKIINKDGFSEEVIWRFMNILSDAKENTREWIINNSIHENDLLKHWTFSDGSPCGKLMEEE